MCSSDLAALLAALNAAGDELGCHTLIPKIGMDGQASHFGQAFRVDLERAAADQARSREGDEKRVHAGQVALHQLSWKQTDQIANGGHVAGVRGANQQTGLLLGHAS